MKSNISIPVLIALLACIPIGSIRADDDEKIALSDAPAPVQAAIAKLAGDQSVKLEKASEDGKVSYEATIKKNSSSIEYAFNPDGTLVSTEEKISEDQVPQEVMAAVKANIGDGKIKHYEKVVENGDTTYEVPYMTAKGKKYEMVLTPGGTVKSNGEDKD